MNIQESLDAILSCTPVFGQVFYDTFFAAHPEVRAYFDGVDMPRQSLALTMALIIVAKFSQQEQPATRAYLQHLGTKHYDRRVPRDAYAKWRDAMLTAMRRFHGERWSPELADQWAVAIDRSINVLLEGYQNRYPV